MLRKADVKITRELDLVRFIKQRQIQSLSLLAGLARHDFLLLEKMANLVIHESTLSEYSCSGNLDPDQLNS